MTFLRFAVLLILGTSALVGCRACGTCYDYSPPVSDCVCGTCGSGRAGSNISGGMVAAGEVIYEETPPHAEPAPAEPTEEDSASDQAK
ncbi:MAG: hypothetical protein WD851_01815 [Pirellulales bacterium]